MAERTLKINADLTELKVGLKDLATSIDRLSQKMDEMGQRTKTNMTNAANGTRKTRQAVSELEVEYNKLKARYNELQSRRTSLDNKQKKEISDIIAKMKSLRSEMTKTGTTGAAATDKVTAAQKRLNTQVSLGRQLFLRLKSVMITVFGAYAIIQGIRNTINTIKDFELGMARVAAITGATSEELKQLSATARVLATRGIFNPTEIAAVEVQLAKFGFTVSEISDSLEGIIQLATATGEELGSSAELVSSSIRALGLSADETGRLVDVLGKSFTSSALDINKFRESAKYILPLARTMGWEIEEVAAVLGRLADAGISGSLAGTGLRQTFIQLLDSGSKLSGILGDGIRTFDDLFDAIERAKESGVSFEAVLDTIPTRAKTMFTVLYNNVGAIREMNIELEKANGAIDEMANIQLETLAGQLDRVASGWQAVLTSTQQTGGIMRDIAKLIADDFEELAEMIDPIGFAIVDAQKRVSDFRDGLKDLDPSVNVFVKIAEKIAEVDKALRANQVEIDNIRWAYNDLNFVQHLIFDADLQIRMKNATIEAEGLKAELQGLYDLLRKMTGDETLTDTEAQAVLDGLTLSYRLNLLEIDKFNMLQRAKRIEDEQNMEEQILAINKYFEVEKLKLTLQYGELTADEREKINEKIIELEKGFEFELTNLREDFTQERLEAEIEAEENRLKVREQINKRLMDIEELRHKTEIQNMKNEGATKEEIWRKELEFQIRMKELEIERAEAREDDILTIITLREELKLLNAELAGGFMGDDADKNINKTLNAYKRLANELIDYFQDIADAHVENTERLVDDLNTRIAETQRALETETELYAAGYASNVTLKREELEELEKARREAIADRERAIKRQQALESVSQAINLATATSNLISQYSKIPYVGIALAGIAILGMLSLFASMKAKGASLAQYGEGGEIDGKPHSQGGVIIEAEGGEFVMNKKAYAKYPELIKAINEDNLPKFNPSIMNNVANSGDVIIDNEIWHKMYNLWDKNLNKGKVEVIGNRKIITRGIRKRTINV